MYCLRITSVNVITTTFFVIHSTFNAEIENNCKTRENNC